MSFADRGVGRVVRFAAIAALAAALTSCAAPQKQTGQTKKRSKEYFAESAYGVKASPRVSNLRTKLPRGGGRDQVGKPYMVKGRWYHPKEEPGYTKVGEASWYGDAFHGRLTANGEIYDMTHLTAAHPTMPLPSYARVTNMKNGNSVIVRVNDRGPFERGRVIDLSRKAAEMLDYAHAGMAEVKVDYVGRAPLHGKDDSFLMASYRPGGGKTMDPSDGLPTGVMIAMMGSTPTQASPAAARSLPAFAGIATASLTLPDFGPMAPDRPASIQMANTALSTLSYAQERVEKAASAFRAFDTKAVAAKVVAQSWKENNGGAGYVAVGTYGTKAEAIAATSALASLGEVAFDVSDAGVAVSLKPNGQDDLDDLLQAAWRHGASDAFVVRD